MNFAYIEFIMYNKTNNKLSKKKESTDESEFYFLTVKKVETAGPIEIFFHISYFKYGC